MPRSRSGAAADPRLHQGICRMPSLNAALRATRHQRPMSRSIRTPSSSTRWRSPPPAPRTARRSTTCSPPSPRARRSRWCSATAPTRMATHPRASGGPGLRGHGQGPAGGAPGRSVLEVSTRSSTSPSGVTGAGGESSDIGADADEIIDRPRKRFRRLTSGRSCAAPPGEAVP